MTPSGGARETSTAYSTMELMAVTLARDLRDGDVVRVGVAMPVAEAAVRLAHLLHGPNMELIFSGVQMNAADLGVFPMPQYGWDRRALVGVESYSDTGHRFDRMKDWHRHVFFVGGIQVDPFGNINLIGIGHDHRRLRFRGPGSVGTPTLTTHVGRYYIVLNSHTRRVLVEKCDHVSAVGWHTGGADARRKLGLPGGGPRLCITPLGVLDFHDDTKRMRVRSVHRGTSAADLQAQTAFDLAIPPSVPSTEPPTAEELHALRTRIDLTGVLRGRS
jgi:glutaconate CoA-transferase subunit B